MKKSTLAAQGGAGVIGLALLASLVHADSIKYSEVAALEVDMTRAVAVASAAVVGNVIEAELEVEDSTSVWEIEIVDESNRVMVVEVDGLTGEVLSTEADDDDHEQQLLAAVSLTDAIDLVTSIENGALVEAELENEDGALVWEVESVSQNNTESQFRIHAETGEILK